MLAYRAGRAIRADEFLAAAAALAATLPAGRHVINVCADRYRFAVGLAAAVLAGKVSLLPPSHTPQVVRHLRQFAPDVFCLTDAEECAIDLPQVRVAQVPAAPRPWRVPQLPPDTLVAYVFTSG